MNKIMLAIAMAMLAGCSGAYVKKEIAADLNKIVQNNSDCENVCGALKMYLRTKLGQ